MHAYDLVYDFIIQNMYVSIKCFIELLIEFVWGFESATVNRCETFQWIFSVF